MIQRRSSARSHQPLPAWRFHFCFFGTSDTVPPAASIFWIADSENAVALIVTPALSSPSPSTSKQGHSCEWKHKCQLESTVPYLTQQIQKQRI